MKTRLGKTAVLLLVIAALLQIVSSSVAFGDSDLADVRSPGVNWPSWRGLVAMGY